jgi:hypothetical protein
MYNPSDDVARILARNLDNQGGFSLHYLMLFSLIYGMEAKNVFEFGSGFTTPVILSALKLTGGKLTTNDKRDLVDTGNSPTMLETEKERWRYLSMYSEEALKQVKGETYDVVLHDGAHEFSIVWRDIRKIVKQMKQDSILIVHDTDHKKFPYMKLAVRFGLLFCRYDMVTLPYGFGLTIVRIKSNFGNGRVELAWKKAA